MVAGVASRQFAMLVIAVDDGVMPQSREHLQILTLLGLSRGIVVLNKIDRVPPARVDEVRREVEALTAGTFLHKAPTLPVSCTTGTGIDDVRRHITLAARADRAAGATEPFRLPIDRAFTVRGSGTVVTGTVLAGTARTDDPPRSRRHRHRRSRPRRARAESGRRSRNPRPTAPPFNLAGVSAEEVTRGDWLLPPESREPATRLCIELAVLEDFPRAVKHNHPVHIYHASSHAQARILLIDETPTPGGTPARVDLASSTPLHVQGRRPRGASRPRPRPNLRRRSRHSTRRTPRSASLPSETGTPGIRPTRRSLDIGPRRHPPRAASRRDLRPPMEPSRGPHGNAGRSAPWTWKATGSPQTSSKPPKPPSENASPTTTTNTRTAAGSPKPSSAPVTSPRQPPLRLALHHLAATGEVRAETGEYALASHQADIPPNVKRLFAEVEKPLDSIQPPSLGDIAKLLKRPFPAFEREMRALPAFGLAIRVSETRYYLPARLLELAAHAETLAAKGPFTVRNFRDATGVGRNVVIEVLEHFDRTGFARRTADTRTIIGNKNAVL